MENKRRSRKRQKKSNAGALLITAVLLAAAIAAVIFGKPYIEKLTEQKAETETETETSAAEETTAAAAPETVEETTAETVPEETSPEVRFCYTMTDVHIRKAPDADSEILAVLPADTELQEVSRYNDEWIEVRYNVVTGYISAEYLSEDSSWREHITTRNGYANGSKIPLDPVWKYSDFSVINSGSATMYTAIEHRKNIVVGVNAGHGTEGGSEKTTYSHPDKTGKVTGGTNAYGVVMSTCVSSGMTFKDGTPESVITLKEAQILKDMLLANGYDVLMIRDGEDVQLDNVARTVICNNAADCHISVHWDSDGLDYDKGVFYCAVPDQLKKMEPAASTWQSSEKLGQCLIDSLAAQKTKIFAKGTMDMDLTQTAYSSIPSVDIELGNQSSKTDDETLSKLAAGILSGIDSYFGFSEPGSEPAG